MALVCIRAEASSLARVCWQRVEQRQRRASEILFCFVLFCLLSRGGALLMACAPCSALCARLRVVCAARALLSLFLHHYSERDTDVVCPSDANCRLLLLARRCYGSSDEPDRRCCVEPNVDWSRLLAVVGLQDTEFQLQHQWCCSLQRQWLSDALVRPTREFALTLLVFVC